MMEPSRWRRTAWVGSLSSIQVHEAKSPHAPRSMVDSSSTPRTLASPIFWYTPKRGSSSRIRSGRSNVWRRTWHRRRGEDRRPRRATGRRHPPESPPPKRDREPVVCSRRLRSARRDSARGCTNRRSAPAPAVLQLPDHSCAPRELAARRRSRSSGARA